MASSGAVSELIDVHSHIYPVPYLELLETRQEIPRVVNRDGKREFLIFPEESHPDVGGREMGAEFTDLESKLAFMDRFGIDRSIVSLGNPWLDPFPDRAGDEAVIPHYQWGEKTDGGAPWIEWYDLGKLYRAFEPTKMEVVLNFEFFNNDFIWFDLIKTG